MNIQLFIRPGKAEHVVLTAYDNATETYLIWSFGKRSHVGCNFVAKVLEDIEDLPEVMLREFFGADQKSRLIGSYASWNQ